MDSTDMHQAVRNDDSEKVTALLRKNPDLVFSREDYLGRTPLHEARSSEMAALLLASKAEVDAKDKEGKTSLHIAAYGNGSVAKVLLANKANVNARDNQGWTALHHGAVAGKEDGKHVAALLLANGAEINARKNDAKTPWRLAAQYEHAKGVAEFLRQHGGHE